MKGKGLLKGMKITWQHFWGKKETVMYPEEKLTMTERFRGGTLDLNIDKCISCKLCEIACPNKALSLKVSIDEQKKRHLEEYIYHSGKCLMCDLCIVACRFFSGSTNSSLFRSGSCHHNISSDVN